MICENHEKCKAEINTRGVKKARTAIGNAMTANDMVLLHTVAMEGNAKALQEVLKRQQEDDRKALDGVQGYLHL